VRAYPTVLFEESLQVPLCFVRFADDDASCLARAVVVIHTVPVFFFFSARGIMLARLAGSPAEFCCEAQELVEVGDLQRRHLFLDIVVRQQGIVCWLHCRGFLAFLGCLGLGLGYGISLVTVRKRL